MTFKPNSIVLLLAALGATAATAQTSGHEHAGHGAPAAPVAAQGTTSVKPAGADHGAASSAQGGSAPTDARDPHAYSGGYQLGVGQYALSGTRQLKLADEHNFGALLMNRLERVNSSYGNSLSYDAQAWFGRGYDRLVLKAEGDLAEGQRPDARTEVLWGRAIAPFWDAQLGLRADSGGGPERRWLAVGVQGLAPYWFEVDATAYVGEGGRTALRLGAEYELLLTQKLILQPRVEFSFYGQADEAREIGAGLSSGTAGLRLRYEINRQLAPYVGVEWKGKYGATADLARKDGARTEETRWVAGLRFWF